LATVQYTPAMTDGSSATPRDDRAWPRLAVPISALLGFACLGVSVFLAARHPHPWLVGSAVIGGLAIAVALMITGFRRWFAGEPFPRSTSVLAGGAAVAGWIGTSFLDRTTALLYLLGLLCGCMFANVWAIRKARRNRPN
jgi:hypothetical protein